MSANRPRISVYIIALNEEHSIRRTIESVRWAGEIVVLDSGSADATCDIARELGARVEYRRFEGFAAQKNAVMAMCRGAWLLNLDADEEVTPELRSSIQRIVGENRGGDIYAVNRKTRYLGHWIRHCGWYPEYRARLCRSGCATWRGGTIHEYLEADVVPGRLDGDLLHRPYDNLIDHLNKIGQYADIWAREHAGRGERASWIGVTLHPVARFMKMYVLKAGFLDGMPGLIASIMGSYYVFMKYTRLYELTERERKNV